MAEKENEKEVVQPNLIETSVPNNTEETNEKMANDGDELFTDYWRNAVDTLAEFTEKFPIFQLAQARRLLRNMNPNLPEEYENIKFDSEDKGLLWLQKKGYILLTESNHIITKDFYRFISHDTFGDGLSKNDNVRVPKEFDVYMKNKKGERVNAGKTSIKEYFKTDKRRKNIMKSMWIVIDNLPTSKDFTLGNLPWTVMYEEPVEVVEIVDGAEVKKIKTRVVQVAYFSKGEENALAEIIRNKGQVLKEARDSVRRIAMVEDESSACLVPYYGFTEIFTEDTSSYRKIKLVERRNKSDAWKDAGDEKK